MTEPPRADAVALDATSADLAIDDPGTRRAIRTRLVMAAVVLLLGVIGLTLVGLLSGPTASEDEQLMSHGTATTATVVQVMPDERLISVEYVGASLQLLGNYAVGGHASRYSVGQVVSIHYDPDAPSEFALDAEVQSRSLAHTVATGCQLLGLVLLVAGGYLGVVAFDLRSALTKTPWQPVLIDCAEPGLRGKVPVRVWFLDEAGQPNGRFETFTRSNAQLATRLGPTPPGHGEPAIYFVPDGGWLKGPLLRGRYTDGLSSKAVVTAAQLDRLGRPSTKTTLMLLRRPKDFLGPEL